MSLLKIIQSSFLFLFTLILFSCKSIQPVTVDEIESIHVTSISPQSIQMQIGLKINNPNNTKFTIKESDLNVFINNLDLGKAMVKDKIIIPPNFNQTLFANVETNIAQLLFQALPLISAVNNHELMKVKISGTVKVKAFFITKSYPVELEKEMAFK